jgi:K+-transporting ATPase ATPase C chain
MNQLAPAVLMLVWLSLVTGIAYPLLVTGIAQLLFPVQANGSLVVRGGTPVGSSLIGQPFDDPKYFWGRLSATAPHGYAAGASSGSNLGPLNPNLHAATRARIDALREADPGNTAPVPVDLATASGSGLDPHISPAAAFYQAPRVARARQADPAAVRRLVEQHIEGRQLGILGEPRVNVLALNLALDRLAPARSARAGGETARR